VASALKGDQPMGRLLRPLANRLLPTHPIPVTVLSGPAKGLKVVIEPHDEKSLWTGSHEPEVLSVMGDYLKPGSVCWDVGAHIGLHALFAGRCVGPSGHVHAFEPAAVNVARLRRGIALNHATNITIHEMALSDKTGTAVLYDRGSNPLHTLIDGPRTVRGETVFCDTADRMAERLGRPDLIKIDVEGAEKMVLAGARDLLSRDPPVLIVEYWTEADVAHAKAAFPQYRFTQLDQMNWLMTPGGAEQEAQAPFRLTFFRG
jgi:FkbM family methyltransferase